MKFLKQNINYIIFAIIFILLIIIFFLYSTKEKESISTFKNDGIQLVKIYTNKNANKIFKKIEKEKDTNNIIKILNDEGVSKYIINNNGIVTAGNHYGDGKYSVSIIKDGKVTDIVYLKNETLYIVEEDNSLAASIDKDYNKAKENANQIIKNKELKEENASYLIENNKKTMTKKFKKYLKTN